MSLLTTPLALILSVIAYFVFAVIVMLVLLAVAVLFGSILLVGWTARRVGRRGRRDALAAHAA